MALDASLVFGYFPELDDHQREQINKLGPLYEDWNRKINLISRKDIEELYLKHVLHSLSIIKIIQFPAGSRILDVGTGGGFPGIPLAIYFRDSDFFLVDSIEKKIRAVQDVIRQSGLKNVTAFRERAENLKDHYDFIVCRAVARMKEVYEWIHPLLSAREGNPEGHGIIFLKGGDLEEELEELNKPVKIFNLYDHFREDFYQTKKVIYIPAR